MVQLNLTEDQVIELAKQLPPPTRQSLAIALLQSRKSLSLATLRQRSQQELLALLRCRGLEVDKMTSDQIDEAIRKICEEP